MDAANHPALLFVDGVSSIASIDFRMDEWKVDCAISGSQKGFMLPSGMAIMCVSEKALEAHKSAQLKRCYYSWEDQNSYKQRWLFSLYTTNPNAKSITRIL